MHVPSAKRTIAAIVAITLVVALFCYGAAVVWFASEATPEIVSEALADVEHVLEVSDLSPRQLEILLKVEDPGFYDHRGVDVLTPGSGYTTITQSDVKMLYFKPFRPGLQKIKQSLIAWLVFDRLVSKNDQLRIFINRVFLGSFDGQPLYGFDKAARVYFGVPVSQLTEDQFISLVAIPANPAAYNPYAAVARNAERSRRIKKLIEGTCAPNGWRDVLLEGCRD